MQIPVLYVLDIHPGLLVHYQPPFRKDLLVINILPATDVSPLNLIAEVSVFMLNRDGTVMQETAESWAAIGRFLSEELLQAIPVTVSNNQAGIISLIRYLL